MLRLDMLVVCACMHLVEEYEEGRTEAGFRSLIGGKDTEGNRFAR